MSTISTTNLKNPSSGSNNIVLNADGTTTVAAPSNIIKSGTAVASTSGVAIDFTGIPSWAKRVTVMFNGVSTNGTGIPLVQIGSGSIISSGYLGSGSSISSGVGSTNFTTGFGIGGTATAAFTRYGTGTLINVSGNVWVFSAVMAQGDSAQTLTSGGSVTLSGILDRIRITTVNGTDTFDAGSINILYEG